MFNDGLESLNMKQIDIYLKERSLYPCCAFYTFKVLSNAEEAQCCYCSKREHLKYNRYYQLFV